MLRRGPRAGPSRDRGRGGQREARDRDTRGRRGEGRGPAPPRAGGWVRPSRRGGSAVGAPRMSDVLAVGLMSGTSLDGISAALVRLADRPAGASLVAFHQEPYTVPERGQIIDTIARGGARELAVLHVALAERFAGAAL